MTGTKDQPAFTRRGVLATGLAVATSLSSSARAADQGKLVSIEPIPDGVAITFEKRRVIARITHPGVITVMAYPATEQAPPSGPFDTSSIVPGTLRRIRGAKGVRVIGGGVALAVDGETGRVSAGPESGDARITEIAPASPVRGVPITQVQSFEVSADDALFGLGQYREPEFDYRGKQIFVAQANTDAANPFLVSTGGWGLLWETGTAAYFVSEGGRVSFQSVAGDLVRYHVVIGDDIDALIAGYRRLTGKAALLGKWAYGYWQSKERYQTQQELLSVVDEYRARGLPFDNIVLDWHYWGENDQFSSMRFDPAIFPDPKGMMDHVHRQNAHIIASIWPAFGPKTEIYRDMAAAGGLFPGQHWSGGKVFDVTAPDAQAIYWRHIDQGLMSIGLDGLWTDGCEPEFMSTNNRYATARFFAANGDEAAGPIVRNLLTYSWWQSSLLSSRMDAQYPERRPFILTRKVYPGQQAFGAVTWSGDIFASWQTLRNQVVAAMNYALAGNPHWTCDIGGFLVSHRYPDGLSDPAYTELYVRWFQWGGFLPVFRAHGTNIPRELWQFGKPGTPVFEALKAALELRYSLMPYIYSVAAEAAIDDGTIMRPLVMDFAGDPAAVPQQAQYMFGPSMMVRVVDRPLYHASANDQEFIPYDCVRGIDAPAAEVTFYEGANFERQVARYLSDDFKMSWTGDLPPSLAGKPYSTRWRGKLVPKETGRHRFVVTAQGALQFDLAGARRIDAHGPAGDANHATGGVSAQNSASDRRYTFDVDLVAGQDYPFVLEQRQPTPDAISLWVEWVTPTQRRLSTIPSEKTVQVYLPGEGDWYDLHAGSRHRGGQTITMAAPLSRMPVFVRAGAILPMTPKITYATEPAECIELHVYPGADGQFRLYDDIGDGDGYRRGEHAWIDLAWDDARRTLHFGERLGQFEGMRESITFHCRVHDDRAGSIDRKVTYLGRPAAVSMN